MLTFKSGLEIMRRSYPIWKAIGEDIILKMKDDIPSFLLRWDNSAARELMQISWKEGGVSAVQEVFLNGRMMVEGPRIFRPSYEQCVALEKIEPRLSVSEYHQPFATMVVEFPDRYSELLKTVAKDIKGNVGATCPRWAILHHAPELPALVCSTNWDNGSAIARTIHHYGAALPTIAEVINEATGLPPGSDDINEQEEAATHRSLRAAINGLLLLTHYGHKNEPENPGHHERLKRFVKLAQKRGDSETAERDLHLSPMLCDFDQTVILHEERGRQGGRGEPTGETVSSHWRRGHMRRQPHGEKNLLRKLIFIKPVLIHPESAAKPSSVTYIGGGKT